MGVDYATTLTQSLSKVLASYSMQCFSHSHVINWFIPIPSHGWSYSHGSHGKPVGPMKSQSSPFPCTSSTHSPVAVLTHISAKSKFGLDFRH